MLHGIICGLGFGFFQSPNNRELIGSAPREKSGSAAGLLAVLRVGGQTLGTALVAIAFGLFGASLAAGAGHEVVARSEPIVLWAACAFSAAATVASGGAGAGKDGLSVMAWRIARATPRSAGSCSRSRATC